MNEQSTVETPAPEPTLPQPNQPTVSSLPLKKQNWLQRTLSSRKGRIWVFAGLFGVVGAGALFVILAATTAERDLIVGFRNLARNRPTVVSGNVNLIYKDSPNLKSAQLTYRSIFNPSTGNSRGNGQLTINSTKFNYDYTTINKDHYFRLGNTPAVKNVIKPSSQLYPYFSSRFRGLENVNNQWLVQKHQASTGEQSSSGAYDCALSTYPYMSASDAQRLQSLLLKNSPLKVKEVTNTVLGNENVTRTVLVMRDTKSVDNFAAQIQDLDFVRKINSCVQQTTNANAVEKLRDALKNNNVSISVFMNDAKTIKKISLETNSTKSNLSFNADFAYTTQSPITAPAGAKPADEFLRKMTDNTRTQF